MQLFLALRYLKEILEVRKWERKKIVIPLNSKFSPAGFWIL